MRKILFLMLCILFLTHTAADDFGDFSGDSDYGGGWDSSDWDSGYSGSGSSGGWDGGYSGWDSGYSGSGGGGCDGGGGWDSGYGGGSRSSSTDSDGTTIAFIIILLLGGGALLAKALFFYKNEDQRPALPLRRTEVPPGASRTSTASLRPIGSYPSVDPNFSEVELKQRLSNIYLKLQDAWEARDLRPVRPYLTDVLYNQYDRQLNNYRNTGTTNVTEHVTVLGIILRGWRQEGGNDVIVAELRSRLRDYVIEDSSGRLVRGSRTAEKFMEYEYTLTRKSGMKTGLRTGVRTVNCPNCGSAVDINQSAVCKYCGSTLQAAPEDWVISGIKGLSQRTVNQ